MLAWLTFISATLAATFQGRRAVQGWLYDQLDRREARRADLAGWSRGGVDTWSVRIAEPGCPAKTDAPEHAAAVTVTVCDKHGQPSPLQADRLRRYLAEHGHISRAPGPAELDTLDQAAADGGRLALTQLREFGLLVDDPAWPEPDRLAAFLGLTGSAASCCRDASPRGVLGRHQLGHPGRPDQTPSASVTAARPARSPWSRRNSASGSAVGLLVSHRRLPVRREASSRLCRLRSFYEQR